MKIVKQNAFDRFIAKRKLSAVLFCLALILAGFISLAFSFKELRYDRSLARARSPEALRKLAYNSSLAGDSIGLTAALKLENIYFSRKDYQNAINVLRLVESWNVDADVKASVQADILLILKIQGKLKDASEMARGVLADGKAKSSLRLLAARVEAQLKLAEGEKDDAEAVLKEALDMPANCDDAAEREEVEKALAELSGEERKQGR